MPENVLHPDTLPPGESAGDDIEWQGLDEASLAWVVAGAGLLYVGYTHRERCRQSRQLRVSLSRRQTVILEDALPEPEPLMAPFDPAAAAIAPSAADRPHVEHYADGSIRIASSRQPATKSTPLPVDHRSSVARDSTATIGEPPRRRRGWVWSTVATLLAAACFWNALPSGLTGPSPAVATVVVVSTAEPTLITRPIEQIQPGQRVLASNPELDGEFVPRQEIDDPTDWRLVSYRMPKPDGSFLFVDMLQRLAETLPLAVNAEVPLAFPELGIDGIAAVTSIAACPPIGADDGRLVTATFHHTAANVINVEIAGEPVPIGTTSNHPFWSEDRQAFIQAGDLHIGERFGLQTVLSRKSSRSPHPRSRSPSST